MKHRPFWLIALLAVLALVFSPVPEAAASGAEPVTVTVFVGEPGQLPAENNRIYQLIEQEFGIRFRFEFLEEGSNLDETLGIKINNRDYEDLFCGGNSNDAVIGSGALINLLDYLSPETTPLLWEHIQSCYGQLVRQDENGNDVLYVIPNYGLSEGTQKVSSVSGPAFFVQKQVLAAAGYPDVKNLTIDDYFDLIDNFIARNPTDENGIPYTGFAILCEDWRHYCLLNPVQHLMGRPNDGEVLVDVNDENLHTETFIDKEYAKAYYKKLNEEYHKGIISSDTFVMSYDDYIGAISGGHVLGMFDQAWDFGTATSALQQAGMYENTYVALGPVYSQDTEGIPDGWQIEEHYLNGSGSNPNVNRGYGISVNCQDPERIVAMWEAMMSEEWQLLLNWGVEGEDYTIENGRLVMTEEQYANSQNPEWRLANSADALFNNSPKRQGTIQEGDLAGNSWAPSNQDEIINGLMNDYDKAFLAEYGYLKWSDFMNDPIELAPYGEAWMLDYTPIDEEYAMFNTIQDLRLPQLILADPSEFDGIWDTFVTEITPYAQAVESYMQQQILIAAGRATVTADGTFGENLAWSLAGGTLTVSGTGDMPDFEDRDVPPWFDYRSAITGVVIEDGVTGIGSDAFYEHENLASVTMADSVTRIGSDAFLRCEALNSLQLSAGLTEIGPAAFAECPALTSVALPGSLETIGTAAFAADGLTSVTVADGDTVTRHFFYPGNDGEWYLYHIALPAGLTDPGYGTFCYNPLPHDDPDFILPSGLVTVEQDAFRNTDARYAWLPESARTLGASAFAECDGLEYVYVPYYCEIEPGAIPAGTVILGVSGSENPAGAEAYADANGCDFIDLEDPFGGNG
ncbi:MAG: leucine-rich repeat protein [Clostridia bacterium]|nr:leucine-rich repeat protein [Clostridia bacterium]